MVWHCPFFSSPRHPTVPSPVVLNPQLGVVFASKRARPLHSSTYYSVIVCSPLCYIFILYLSAGAKGAKRRANSHAVARTGLAAKCFRASGHGSRLRGNGVIWTTARRAGEAYYFAAVEIRLAAPSQNIPYKEGSILPYKDGF